MTLKNVNQAIFTRTIESMWPQPTGRHCDGSRFINDLERLCVYTTFPVKLTTSLSDFTVFLCLNKQQHVLLSPRAGQHEKSPVLYRGILPQAL